MDIIRQAAVEHCFCPEGGYQPASDVTWVDYIDGYPAEYNEYSIHIDSFGIDTGNPTDDAALRELLNIPDSGVGTDGYINLKYRLGSGIRVSLNNNEIPFWKGFRLDCGCLKYECGIEETTIVDSLPCPVNNFVNDNNEFDFNPDQLTVIPRVILREYFGINDGTVLDGSIPNLMFCDSSIQNTPSIYNGIPLVGSFSNYVDPYGIVYSAYWHIYGDNIDITFTTCDPRIPGEPESGRVERVGNKIRVIKTGIITTTRQLLRVVTDGYVIVGQGTTQVVGEFQANFGCGDEYGDPFHYHLNNYVTDVVELISTGGSEDVVLLRSPPEPAEFIWWPSLVDNSSGTGFVFYDGGQYGPLSEIPLDE